MLCGQFASEMTAAAALRNMLRVAAMPVVTTFQVSCVNFVVSGWPTLTWSDSQVAATCPSHPPATSPLLLVRACGPAGTRSCGLMLSNAHMCPFSPSPWQGAGVVGQDQAELYGGRVGLIHNTLADRLLDMADVVVAVGYVRGSLG